MRGIILLFFTAHLFGCAAPAPYIWQDTRQPVRDDAAADLEECRAYAARQYQPGMPAGASYLADQANMPEGAGSDSSGQWRPDRSPFPTTSVGAQNVHDVHVDYTGYPGELDYYPGYLDDILEKCMHDRGWVYQPVKSAE